MLFNLTLVHAKKIKNSKMQNFKVIYSQSADERIQYLCLLYLANFNSLEASSLWLVCIIAAVRQAQVLP